MFATHPLGVRRRPNPVAPVPGPRTAASRTAHAGGRFGEDAARRVVAVLLTLGFLVAGSHLVRACPPAGGCEGSCGSMPSPAAHACCESGEEPAGEGTLSAAVPPGGCACVLDAGAGGMGIAVLASGVDGRARTLLAVTEVAALVERAPSRVACEGRLAAWPVRPPGTLLFLATAALLI